MVSRALELVAAGSVRLAFRLHFHLVDYLGYSLDARSNLFCPGPRSVTGDEATQRDNSILRNDGYMTVIALWVGLERGIYSFRSRLVASRHAFDLLGAFRTSSGLRIGGYREQSQHPHHESTFAGYRHHGIALFCFRPADILTVKICPSVRAGAGEVVGPRLQCEESEPVGRGPTAFPSRHPLSCRAARRPVHRLRHRTVQPASSYPCRTAPAAIRPDLPAPR